MTFYRLPIEVNANVFHVCIFHAAICVKCISGLTYLAIILTCCECTAHEYRNALTTGGQRSNLILFICEDGKQPFKKDIFSHHISVQIGLNEPDFASEVCSGGLLIHKQYSHSVFCVSETYIGIYSVYYFMFVIIVRKWAELQCRP